MQRGKTQRSFDLLNVSIRPISLVKYGRLGLLGGSGEWRRQLWGTGVRAPSTSNNFTFSSLWRNLTANYPSIV